MASVIEPPAVTSRAGKYLTFALGREEYGLEILKVREIIGYMEITTVPNAASHVRGVINLRGQVIPIVELRSLFGMPVVERTQATCIIVVDIRTSGGARRLGMLVDHVSEVLDIGAESIEDAPSLGNQSTNFLRGMAKVGNTVKILLDIDAALASQDQPVE